VNNRSVEGRKLKIISENLLSKDRNGECSDFGRNPLINRNESNWGK
jgi:hypothetical protein